MSLLNYCTRCNAYTLQLHCPHCTSKTITKKPPRFSPEDPYGSYRRKAKKETMGV